MGDVLEQTASKFPDRDAIVYPRRDQRWTYAEFDDRVNRLASGLADLGVEKGDRVSTMLHNGSEIVLTVYACAKLGAVFNPLNYRFPAGEAEFIVDDAGSEVVVLESATREADGRTWYYTGDLGRVDEDGHLHVVDRKDDMIVSGGENVYPTAVENVLFTHEDVVEAAVVGEPDEEWGERIVAYVVGDASAEEFDRFVRDSDDVADFKRPRAYYFVEELPKNPSGKVQKFRLPSEEDGAGETEGVEVT